MEHLKRCGYAITILRSNLLIACIIQENQNLLDERRREASPKVSFHKPAQAFVKRKRGDAMECMSSVVYNGTQDMQSASPQGQAIKSARGMPWHQEPTKDVTSCDKHRGGANIR